MERKPYPSEEANRFQVRMPDGMREAICEAAARNGRSMNSEIIARLQGSNSSLSPREHFAGLALQGLLQGHFAHYGHDNFWAPYAVADHAIECADALIAELSKAEGGAE